MRRIGLIANAILLALAVVLLAGAVVDLHTSALELVGSLALLAPPALTFLALRGRRSDARPDPPAEWGQPGGGPGAEPPPGAGPTA